MKNFNLDEFESPDQLGSGTEMQSSTLDMLDKTRELAGIPFVVTSGYRTAEHNRKVGGVEGSSHRKGYAVDISCDSSGARFKILEAALASGFNRIGVGGSFIHLDNDPDKSVNVIWTY